MAGLTGWIGSIQQRLDTWARQQRDRGAFVSPPLPQVLPWPRWHWNWKWPWQDARERKQKLHEEYKRREEQIQNLCRALKAEDMKDLQDVLSAMILSECVYKRPESEVIRALSKFKADFGEQLVPLERVQASLEHVQHRYLLAEAGDTLFASFIGTKQYKDVIADANILQGTLFHEEYDSDNLESEDNTQVTLNKQGGPSSEKGQVGLKLGSPSTKGKGRRSAPKPAAHRGFLARANGIPAVELYRLAKKKDCRLVLCGHSLGGAVAVLATLAILRVFASSPVSKSEERVQVKCITFSQPPVGNAALRDYVHKKGWHQHFRTYCIPEDIIPRILSPAYFQHYRTQASVSEPQRPANDSTMSSNSPQVELIGNRPKEKTNEGERLVLGLGPLHNSLWRISRLVPLVGAQKPFLRFKNRRLDLKGKTSTTSISSAGKGEPEAVPESLNIQEGAEAVALTAISLNTDVERPSSELGKAPFTTAGRKNVDWRSRVPSLPSYVPFGQLFLLEKSSVEPLSASEYTRLTSMQSVLLELRERFQSHTMRSYRARFQRIYDLCMCDGTPPLFAMEHLPHLPHLQQWLGFPGAVVTEVGRIAEPLIVRTATSVVPVGWTGLPGERNRSEPLRVDVQGYGLHLCTLVKAQINGQWCSTTVESSPTPPCSLDREPQNAQPTLQKMRIRIGAPIQQNSSQPNAGLVGSTSAAADSMPGTDRMVDNFAVNGEDLSVFLGAVSCQIEGLSEVTIHCSSDFMSVSKKVAVRLRRVRLLGLEGAGKTSLYYALLGQGRGTTFSNSDGVLPNLDWQEGVAQGVAYIDPAGANLQDLAGEVNQLKQELSFISGQLSKKVDLVILVHNLAHKIPMLHQSAQAKPALSALMDEVTLAGIHHILAITNKFAVSADRRQSAAAAVMETYKVPSILSVVVNSCPYAVHGVGGGSAEVQERVRMDEGRVRGTNLKGAAQRLISAPVNLVQLPFRRKEVVLPVEGVKNLQALVHRILLDHEEAALEELAREHLLLEMRNELAQAAKQAHKDDHALPTTAAASAVGAGLGLVVALLAAAGSSLRKP